MESQLPEPTPSTPIAETQSRPTPRQAHVQGAPQVQTRSLLMWSGGLDSTYALVRLLRETQDEVFAHHVHCNVRCDDGRERSRRCEYEARAVVRLLPLLRTANRDFHYSESRVDLTAFSAFARDTATMMYFAAQAAMSHGLTPFDRIVFGVNADEDRRWQPHTELYALRRLLTIRMLKAVWEGEEVPYFYLWNPRPSRREEIHYLPAEMFAATASCRHPLALDNGYAETHFQACGACIKCRSLKAARARPRAASPSDAECAMG